MTMTAAPLESWLAKLSPPQREAVLHERGPLLVVAGAGSGKTRTLTARAGYLTQQGVAPEKILVATFTNRAATEFRGRLENLLGPVARRLWMGTLHSAGARIIRMHGGLAGFSPDFVIFDTGDSLKALNTAAARLGLEKDTYSAWDALQRISYWKGKLLTSEEVLRTVLERDPQDPAEVTAARLMLVYRDILDLHNALDFGDLVINCVRLLERCPDVRRKIGLAHVMVDEYQDVDPAQKRMIELLLGEDRDLTCVGDPDQSIYRWRGAEPGIMQAFTEDFPGARVISLGQNYRSTQAIVSAAEAVVKNNSNRIQHRIWSDNGVGKPVVVVPVVNGLDEAVKVSQNLNLIHQQMGVPWREMAVLFRANHQSQALEQQLIHRGVPYYVVGSRFFDRAVVRDLVRYLRVIYQPEDVTALEEIVNRPVRGITKAGWSAAFHAARAASMSVWDFLCSGRPFQCSPAAKEGFQQLVGLTRKWQEEANSLTLSELADKVQVESGLRAWYAGRETERDRLIGTSQIDNLNQLLLMIRHSYNGPCEDALPEFLTYVALMQEERTDLNQDAVQLMTLHAAKGTEFQVAMLVGVEEDLLPHWRASRDLFPLEAIEEERRLFYVGMTRAKEWLLLFHAGVRQTPNGPTTRCKPSRFLEEIPAELRVRWSGLKR
jgi:DNA helicase-2/ATP-dependent DNA helicase PcrA